MFGVDSDQSEDFLDDLEALWVYGMDRMDGWMDGWMVIIGRR